MNNDQLFLVISILLGMLLVFVAVIALLRSVARRKEISARQSFPNARRIDRAASFLGQESRGIAQLRGTGVLILTDTELIFEMWISDQKFRIPLQKIQSIETPKSFLGKSRFTPLLKVTYLNEQGTSDAVAWHVADLAGWIRLIDAARGAAPALT